MRRKKNGRSSEPELFLNAVFHLFPKSHPFPFLSFSKPPNAISVPPSLEEDAPANLSIFSIRSTIEATEEVEGIILEKILPPRLEEAGLEDCALPPESIMEAFAKAASAVRSVLSASSDDDVDKAERPCANDHWPAVGEGSSDALVGICDGVGDVPGSCSNEKGGGVSEVAGYEIAVGGEDKKADELVVGGAAVPESGEQACVDGLKGLEIGEKSKGTLEKKPSNGDDDSEEKVAQIPILTEGYV